LNESKWGNLLKEEFYKSWFSNVRGDILAGLVVALALIPEAIAFSIIAGVDPSVGLYASFSISILTAIFGGRPGMISAATAATAVLMVLLVKEHGLQYLLAATVLVGILQVLFGLFKLGALMKFVSRSVITGFVNALAILIFIAQIPELIDVSNLTYLLVALGLFIIYFIPRFTKSIPSPLLCIILLTILSVVLDTDLKTVGDLGELPKTLPIFLIPSIPITLETFLIIFPYSSAIALVGLLESLMTATIVDDLTNTTSNKNKECIGQGIANCATGFLGGMAGCAMIGQSIINIKSGGRGRLSSLCAGIFLLVMCVSLSDLVQLIPMAALVAVMIMVSVSTFDWQSIKSIRRNPKSSSVVMLATVVTVVFSHNLAIGVLVGVLLSSLFLASKIAKTFKISSELSIDKKNRVYLVHGQVFFASASHFVNEFDFSETLEKIIIDVSNAHIWDVTSVAALETVTTRFQEKGTLIQIIGINHASKKIIHKYSGSKMNHMLISFQELQNS